MSERDERRDVPSRTTIEEWLNDLIKGKASREDAAYWASTWVERDELDWPDSGAWQAMKMLTAAHLKTQEGVYFHGPNEFREWLNKLRASPLPDTPRR